MFTKDECAQIRALCHEEMRFLHRINRIRGTYRYLCRVNGVPVFTHDPRGDTMIDFDSEPNL